MERINLQKHPTRKGVLVERVSFPSHDVTLVGNLYLPDSDESQHDAVIVAGAWTTVKEQMAGTYARELAARGYAALAFDFTGWGESGGASRFIEDPVTKTKDLQAASKYIASRKDVNGTRLFGVGVCASSGYIAQAAADGSFQAIALVAPWLHNQALATQIYGGPEMAAKLMQSSEAASKHEIEAVVEAASTTNQAAPMYNAPYYTEADRGLISAYDNKFNLRSWTPWLTYDGHASADQLAVPLLMVGSDAMALPGGAAQYEAKMRSPPKKVWLDNVVQFDFYDRADIVEQAADAVASHFSGTA